MNVKVVNTLASSLMLLFFLTESSLAATAGKKVNVEAILLDDTAYGGCMAKVSPSPATYNGVSCAANYVTFSCTGEYNSKSISANKFAAAQLAYVTGNQLYIIVDDTKKHNGYCYAKRVDNAPATQ